MNLTAVLVLLKVQRPLQVVIWTNLALIPQKTTTDPKQEPTIQVVHEAPHRRVLVVQHQIQAGPGRTLLNPTNQPVLRGPGRTPRGPGGLDPEAWDRTSLLNREVLVLTDRGLQVEGQMPVAQGRALGSLHGQGRSQIGQGPGQRVLNQGGPDLKAQLRIGVDRDRRVLGLTNREISLGN